MRKKIFNFIGIVIICLSNSIYSQSKISSIDDVENRIAYRDSIISEIKNKNIRIDSLNSQIADYNLLADLYYEDNENLKRLIHSKDSILTLNNRMLAQDQTIFSGSVFDLSQVPFCLRQHLALVNKALKAEQLIIDTEDMLLKLNKALDMPLLENKEVVVKKINEPVTKIEKLLTGLLQSDLSSFTNEQKQFIKPGLTERYNKFLIFFK